MKPPNKIYEFHVSNLQIIDASINRVALSLRRAISQRDEVTTYTFVRLYALLLGAWAECRLCKLLYEPSGFNGQARDRINSTSTHLDRWQTAVELAFRKHYGVPRAVLSQISLPHSAYSRYITLINMLQADLRPIIELRNKLAHGQWVYPLNNEGNDVAQEQMDSLLVENLLSLQFKKALISHLSMAIHDLVVSQPTFERDFDKRYQDIVDTRRNLQTRNYQSWVAQMQKKYQRGKEKKIGGRP